MNSNRPSNMGFADICTHNRGSLERDRFQFGFASSAFCFDGHITKSDLPSRNLDFKIKRCFQIGFIKARKGSSGVTGFELSAEHVMGLALLWGVGRWRHGGLVFGAIKAYHSVIYRSSKFDSQNGLRGDEFPREREGHAFGLFVIGYIGCLD
jgi:hypothetical protein